MENFTVLRMASFLLCAAATAALLALLFLDDRRHRPLAVLVWIVLLGTAAVGFDAVPWDREMARAGNGTVAGLALWAALGARARVLRERRLWDACLAEALPLGLAVGAFVGVVGLGLLPESPRDFYRPLVAIGAGVWATLTKVRQWIEALPLGCDPVGDVAVRGLHWAIGLQALHAAAFEVWLPLAYFLGWLQTFVWLILLLAVARAAIEAHD